jgi:hypothetical protein
VPPSPRPICGPQTNAQGRFILHHFREQLDNDFATIFYPHNQNARQPAGAKIFPPDVLVDMWYGCAALLQWGMNETIDKIRHSVESEYYDNVNSNGEDDNGWDGGDGANGANGGNGTNGGDDLNGGRLTPRKGKEKAHSVGVDGAGLPGNRDSNGGDDLNGGSLSLPKGARTAPTPRLKTMDDVMDFLLLLWSHQKSGHREDLSISTQEKEQSRDKVRHGCVCDMYYILGFLDILDSWPYSSSYDYLHLGLRPSASLVIILYF